ncbi:MAG TPA: hypothetical protein VFC51_12620 [Chloroflexota bacterium]|nr:hypothetical protein [Chloroflexota bacterium]
MRVQSMRFIALCFCLVPPRGHGHIDDEHTWDYGIYVSRTLGIDHEKALRRRKIMPGVDVSPDGGKVRNVANNDRQDRAAMRDRRSFSGIGDNPHEDHAADLRSDHGASRSDGRWDRGRFGARVSAGRSSVTGRT